MCVSVHTFECNPRPRPDPHPLPRPDPHAQARRPLAQARPPSPGQTPPAQARPPPPLPSHPVDMSCDMSQVCLTISFQQMTSDGLADSELQRPEWIISRLYFSTWAGNHFPHLLRCRPRWCTSGQPAQKMGPNPDVSGVPSQRQQVPTADIRVAVRLTKQQWCRRPDAHGRAAGESEEPWLHTVWLGAGRRKRVQVQIRLSIWISVSRKTANTKVLLFWTTLLGDACEFRTIKSLLWLFALSQLMKGANDQWNWFLYQCENNLCFYSEMMMLFLVCAFFTEIMAIKVRTRLQLVWIFMTAPFRTCRTQSGSTLDKLRQPRVITQHQVSLPYRLVYKTHFFATKSDSKIRGVCYTWVCLDFWETQREMTI